MLTTSQLFFPPHWVYEMSTISILSFSTKYFDSLISAQIPLVMAHKHLVSLSEDPWPQSSHLPSKHFCPILFQSLIPDKQLLVLMYLDLHLKTVENDFHSPCSDKDPTKLTSLLSISPTEVVPVKKYCLPYSVPSQRPRASLDF